MVPILSSEWIIWHESLQRGCLFWPLPLAFCALLRLHSLCGWFLSGFWLRRALLFNGREKIALHERLF